jgi:putative membrane protein
MNLYKHLSRAFAITGLSLSLAVAQTQPGSTGSSSQSQPRTDRPGQTGSQAGQTGSHAGQTGSQAGQTGSQTGRQGSTDRTDHHGGQTGTDRTGARSQSGQTDHTAGAAGENTRGRTDESRVGKQDQQFMTEAAQGSMMEIQLGQLAQEKGSSEGVKEFGRRLQEDHQKASEKLKGIAQQRNLDLPSDMGKHQQHIDKLQNLSGEQFDRAFLRMQIQHHEKDIRKFRNQANRSMDTDVKEFAQGTLPVLQQHLEQAQELAGKGTRSRSQ